MSRSASVVRTSVDHVTVPCSPLLRSRNARSIGLFRSLGSSTIALSVAGRLPQLGDQLVPRPQVVVDRAGGSTARGCDRGVPCSAVEQRPACGACARRPRRPRSPSATPPRPGARVQRRSHLRGRRRLPVDGWSVARSDLEGRLRRSVHVPSPSDASDGAAARGVTSPSELLLFGFGCRSCHARRGANV
jgi:hypothetical protein